MTIPPDRGAKSPAAAFCVNPASGLACPLCIAKRVPRTTSEQSPYVDNTMINHDHPSNAAALCGIARLDTRRSDRLRDGVRLWRSLCSRSFTRRVPHIAPGHRSRRTRHLVSLLRRFVHSPSDAGVREFPGGMGRRGQYVYRGHRRRLGLAQRGQEAVCMDGGTLRTAGAGASAVLICVRGSRQASTALFMIPVSQSGSIRRKQ